ncbi:MAG: hypothetical protein O3B01_31710 [Planctomycetota bacterium]|nr:hypothetical protein [Planctomycetota bacterium]
MREINSKIAAAEMELNAVVYDLYGLTSDEIRLLEAASILNQPLPPAVLREG